MSGSFWSALVVLGDFVAGPLALCVRALLVATAFCGLAALQGRPAQFEQTLNASAAAQGFWVLSLAAQLVLMAALRRTQVETSLTLLLPPGVYPASLLRQADVFVLIGWLVLAWGGWRRGQVGPITALALCGLFWFGESVVRIGLTLLVEAGMRLTLLPD